MFKFLVATAIGYIFGSKAGKERYEKIKETSKNIANHPVAKAGLNYTRTKLADAIHPNRGIKEIIVYPEETVEKTEIIETEDTTKPKRKFFKS